MACCAGNSCNDASQSMQKIPGHAGAKSVCSCRCMARNSHPPSHSRGLGPYWVGIHIYTHRRTIGKRPFWPKSCLLGAFWEPLGTFWEPSEEESAWGLLGAFWKPSERVLVAFRELPGAFREPAGSFWEPLGGSRKTPRGPRRKEPSVLSRSRPF